MDYLESALKMINNNNRKKKVFVSFDYTNDRYYKFLLDAWDKNKNIDFVFEDCSSDEIQSNDISVIRSCLTRKIKETNYTLVIIGKEANKRHKDYLKIGYKNWINFEIAKSKENNNKLVGVKIESFYESPEELLNSNAKWALSFKQDAIIKALSEA